MRAYTKYTREGLYKYTGSGALSCAYVVRRTPLARLTFREPQIRRVQERRL